MLFEFFLVLVALATIFTIMAFTRGSFVPIIPPALATVFWFVITLYSMNVQLIFSAYNETRNTIVFTTYDDNFGWASLFFFLLGIVSLIKTINDILEVWK